jgi:hypothetical protein
LIAVRAVVKVRLEDRLHDEFERPQMTRIRAEILDRRDEIQRRARELDVNAG